MVPRGDVCHVISRNIVWIIDQPVHWFIMAVQWLGIDCLKYGSIGVLFLQNSHFYRQACMHSQRKMSFASLHLRWWNIHNCRSLLSLQLPIITVWWRQRTEVYLSALLATSVVLSWDSWMNINKADSQPSDYLKSPSRNPMQTKLFLMLIL